MFSVFFCIQHTYYLPEKRLYNVFYGLYNGTVVAYQKHYDGDSIYPHVDCREPGIGGNPVSEKIWKITPEWQTEQIPQ